MCSSNCHWWPILLHLVIDSWCNGSIQRPLFFIFTIILTNSSMIRRFPGDLFILLMVRSCLVYITNPTREFHSLLPRLSPPPPSLPSPLPHFSSSLKKKLLTYAGNLLFCFKHASQSIRPGYLIVFFFPVCQFIFTLSVCTSARQILLLFLIWLLLYYIWLYVYFSLCPFRMYFKYT